MAVWKGKGIAFEGVDEALRVPQSDIRLFGKPESFTRRRMGVALANADNIDEARKRAKLAASKVRPVKGLEKFHRIHKIIQD